MTETEIKLLITDYAAARDRLVSLGAKLLRPRHLEKNLFYDFPDHKLTQKRCALRLRITGKRACLAFKGPLEPSRSFKVRPEFETSIQNPGQMKKILRKLGFKQIFAYQKRRTLFYKGHLKIAIDETRAGNYLELEGEKHEITKFARALGFSRKDFIKTDYVALMIKNKILPGKERLNFAPE